MPPSREPKPGPGAPARIVLAATSLLAAPGMLGAQGGPLGPEFRVNTYATGNQRLGSMAAAVNGIFVVAWESAGQDGSQYGVFAQRYNFLQGIPLGGEFQINSYNTGNQSRPRVASDQNANFVVVWQSEGQDGDGQGIFGQRYYATGVPLGGEFRANTVTTLAQGSPDVAWHAPEGFVVVWQSAGGDGSDYGIFGQRYTQDGAPLGPEFRVNTYTTGPQRFPSVSMDLGGNFVVAWEGYGPNEQQLGIFGQGYSSNGTPIGSQFQVNTYTTGNQRYPSVDSAFTGFVVSWQSEGQDGSGSGVVARQYAGPGAPMGPEFQVNGSTASNQLFPSVSGGAGRIVVTWQDDLLDGSGTGIAMRTFFGGNPVTSDWLLNTYVTGPQTRPDVIFNEFQHWTFAWTSAQDPDGSLGVYAQAWQDLPVELQTFTVQ